MSHTTDRSLSQPIFTAREIVSTSPPNRSYQLQPDILYTAEHPYTIGIRAELKQYDPHLVQTAHLTEKEWLLYTVHKKSPLIPLLALQMTPCGRWHNTVKGQLGTSVGITPYSSALMEWVDQHSDQVAVVLQVTPDETLTIGELGRTQPGLYQLRTMTRRQWLELRPVFTTFA